jgi:hypothetical protein
MLIVLKPDYRLDSLGFKSQLVQEIFLFDTNMQAISGAHPASYSVGTGVLSDGVTCPGCEVKLLSASSAQVKNRWNYSIYMPSLCGQGQLCLQLLPWCWRQQNLRNDCSPILGNIGSTPWKQQSSHSLLWLPQTLQ